jgi:NAD(P)-dependent dehydrogenase (short-subunit alcohol dehydrogenase family)
MGTENLDKTKQFIDELNQNRETPYKLFAIELDTSYLGSVRKFAEEVKQLVPKIDILVNSAEQLYEKRDITEEGFERHFVSNYLGIHWILNSGFKLFSNFQDISY